MDNRTCLAPDRDGGRHFGRLVVLDNDVALSIAASEPSPPIAIPTWLSANTGASFIPSPTKATVLPGSSTISRICAALSSGNRFPYARSIPKRLAKEATISFCHLTVDGYPSLLTSSVWQSPLRHRLSTYRTIADGRHIFIDGADNYGRYLVGQLFGDGNPALFH